ncbi:MAG: hypothetical protein M0Z31_13125 [Clostridia bacterium]|nr:hypothetical protein [Clostridia bacterium]
MTKKIFIPDTEKLIRKYKTNIPRIIKAWKKGCNDIEISLSLGVDYSMLQQIRHDLETEHLRSRYQHWLKK